MTTLLVLALLLGISFFIRWKQQQTGHYFWQPASVPEAPAVPVPVVAP